MAWQQLLAFDQVVQHVVDSVDVDVELESSCELILHFLEHLG